MHSAVVCQEGRIKFPDSTSQTLTNPSALPVAIRDESGLNATDQT